jgi:hypothetical protein
VLKFYPGIPGGKLPVDLGLPFICVQQPRLQPHGSFLKLRHIQSGTVFGRMVNLEPFH